MHAKLPDGSCIQSSHEDWIQLPPLPPSALHADVFPKLQQSLISVSQLCDAGCTVIFKARQVTIHYNNACILTGHCQAPGLWMTKLNQPLEQTQQQQQQQPPCNSTVYSTNNIYAATTVEQVRFLHGAAFSPTLSTWLEAINNGHFATWPGITASNVKKYLPLSIATAKGHLDQSRKNQRSTKSTLVSPAISPEPTTTQEPGNLATHAVYVNLTDINDTYMIHTDLTGRFPVTSKRGNKYILLLYDYDTNAILQEPMKSRNDTEMIHAYQVLIK